jgi:hypothetical protein
VLVADQAEVLSILTHKNILPETLMERHFDTFIKMKDKEKVGMYIKSLLESSAYLGFSKIDMQKLT